MDYHFNPKDAKKYGVDEAVMLYNIKHWVKVNRANGTNFHDGCTWTYNSAKAYTELFEFWNEKQIRRILQSLIKQGAIKSGCYNKNKYNHTLWYALTDENTMLPRETTDIPEKEHRKKESVTTITDINKDINQIKSSTADEFDNLITTTEVLARRDLHKNEVDEIRGMYVDNHEEMWATLGRCRNKILYPIDYFREAIERAKRPQQLGLMLKGIQDNLRITDNKYNVINSDTCNAYL